jgi:nitroreductase/Fe-S-cluster-containing hydrogenase component 2
MRLDDRHYPPTRFARFVLDAERCNGCELCAKTCPGQMLAMVDGLPVSKYAAGQSALGCIGCRNCQAVCKRDAIEIRGQYRVEDGYYRTRLGPPAPPNPRGTQPPPEWEALAPDLTEVERVVYTRRSNRLFKDKPVDPALLRRVLEAARFAPSQGNCQPWAFLVITDRALLDRLGKACAGRAAVVSRLYLRNGDGRGKAALRRAAVNLLARVSPNNADQRLAHGIDTIASAPGYDTFLHAPALIVVLGDQRGIGEPMLDCAIATHTMVLVAHSLGLGTCYVGFTKMVNGLPALRRELGIEWPYQVVTSIAVGHPQGRIDGAVARERPPVTWFPAREEATP